MSNGFSKFLLDVLRVVQTSALFTLLALALATVTYSVVALMGLWPWLTLDIRFGDVPVENAGMIFQLGVTAMILGLCAFLPTHSRIMQLERSHRKFSLNMQDVARAYQISHQSDRDGAFTLSKEFDAVRERLLHLRDHPDLGHLEPEILEIAAQMSFQSRDLARIYSDEKIQRARSFLDQRQSEVDVMAERIDVAQSTCNDLKRWLEDVEAEERVAQVQIERLEADLLELLPSLGYEFDADPNVVKLAPTTTGKVPSQRDRKAPRPQ